MFGELLTPMHMLFILIIVLIVFGPKRLPEIGKSLGKGIKEFKKATTDMQEKLSDEDASAPKIDKAEAADTATEAKASPEAKVAPEPKSAETKTT